MKSIGFGAPPGLAPFSAPSQAILEYPDDLLENCSAQYLELSRRVQRMELLLFNASFDTFAKIDAHITSILSQGCDEGSDEDKVEDPCSDIFPESCEVFNLCEDMSPPSEDGPTAEFITGTDFPSEGSHTLLSAELTARVACVEEELAKTRSVVDELEASRAKIVGEVVTPITDIVNMTFEKNRVDIENLQEKNAKYDKQIGKCLEFLEDCSIMLKSQPQVAPPKTSKKGRK